MGIFVFLLDGTKILEHVAFLEASNEALQSHLKSCNIENQHSATFESYLIKPVQRILRYPLFLQQIKTLTAPNTAENVQISGKYVL